VDGDNRTGGDCLRQPLKVGDRGMTRSMDALHPAGNTIALFQPE
jgi:hypothetical protein